MGVAQNARERAQEAIAIRPAVSDDADSIAKAFLQSAQHHASLDSERYFVPEFTAISACYRERLECPDATAGAAITLVAELSREVVGFLDARLESSPDPMHRDITYCHIVEIAVDARHQSRGIGARLIDSAEQWGREHGAKFASLEYLAANTRAGAFYQQRMGYRVAAMLATKRL